jgi:diadenosine tetraphosphate (Ap4A) HIT family hydrolase
MATISNCPFCEIATARIIHETSWFVVIEDGFPVSSGHCLVVSKQHHETFFDLSRDEQRELAEVIGATKRLIETKHTPDGYNIGMNCGEAGGQTVMHFHCHVIPRYVGDMEDPRGGVRYCIPDRGSYQAE